MDELYQQFEQLRDIIMGRTTYNDDNEWADHIDNDDRDFGRR